MQKGAIFGFGQFADQPTGAVLKLATLKDKAILADTPVHNLGEERSVGMINYELNLRGRKNISSCSENLVLNKSEDLIRAKFDQLKNFRKQAQEIKMIKDEWTNKMRVVNKEGISEKEAAALSNDRKKLEDLEFLRRQQPPGPFTSAEEVDEFMAMTEIDEEERQIRLYIEVRYAKMSSSGMKRSCNIFRLMKDHKKLESFDYAHNLKTYFGCVHSVQTITLQDLSAILTGLKAANDKNPTIADIQEKDDDAIKQGEHVACVWADEKDPTGISLTWHLGVVESVNTDSATISYLQQNSTDKSCWAYPETASTLSTPFEQIIKKNLKVEYSCATIIRCKISKQIVTSLNKLLSAYIEKL